MTQVTETVAAYGGAPPLPAHLQLEITSACNLRCTMCLVSYRPPVNKLAGAMTPQLFHQVLEQVPSLRRLTLQGLGEPLLSPYLMDMLEAATARGVTVGFNTNATLLTERRAKALVDTGLDWLHVSLDGATAGTYEQIRAGATFDAVVTNLAGLVAAKRAAGSDLPWVRVVFVAMRGNVAELPEVVRLLAGLGVNELRVQNLSHTFSDADPAGAYREIRAFTADQALWTGADAELARASFDAARDAAREHGLLLRLPALGPDDAAPVTEDAPPAVSEGRPSAATEGRPPPAATPGCTWPWEATYITSTGVVQPCCMVMGDDRVALGRLDEQSFPQIWHGEPYREFRRRLSGDEPPEVCVGCALYQRTF